MRDVIDARTWPADRGWGKAVDFTAVEDGDPLELTEVDREITRVLEELGARRSGQASSG